MCCNAGRLGSIRGSGRSPGRGIDDPLQYSCLKNSMDRGVWWATVHGIAKNQTQLSDLTLHFHSFRGSGVQAQVRLDPLLRISFSSLMAVGQHSQLSSKSLHSDPGSFDPLTNASFLLQSCEEDFSPGCYRVLHN